MADILPNRRVRIAILHGRGEAASVEQMLAVWEDAVKTGIAFRLGAVVARVAHSLIWYRLVEPPRGYKRPDDLPIYGALSR